MLDAELVGVTQSVPKYPCSGSGQWSKQLHQQQLPSVKYSPLKVLFIASSNRVHTHHHLCSIWTNKNVASLSLSTLLFPLFPELQTGDRTESGEARCPVTVRPEPEPELRTQTQQHWSQSVGPLPRGRTPAPATHLATTTAQLQLDIWSWA